MKTRKRLTFAIIFSILTLQLLTYCASASASSSKKPKPISYTAQQIAKSLNWVHIKSSRCNFCKGYYREPKIVRATPHPKAITQQNTRITADGPVTFARSGWSVLRKHVVVTQPGRRITAQTAYVYRDPKLKRFTKLRLVGNVHYQEAGKLLIADEIVIDLIQHTAHLKHILYHLAEDQIKAFQKNKKLQFDAWGTASSGVRHANGVIDLYDATYTTCSPLHPSWQISAKQLHLDKTKGVGRAKNIVIRLHKVPVFFAPRFSFSLRKQRKSGFLGATAGITTRRGFETKIPYYWNMAPNYDLLITPHIMTRRGVLMSGLFRFLTQRMHGFLYLNFIPNDRGFARFKNQQLNNFFGPNQAGPLMTVFPGFFTPYLTKLRRYSNNRGYFAFTDHMQWSDRWTSDLITNYVTDPYYFSDYGNNYGDIRANQLLNQFNINYAGEHWNFIFLLQAFQTLHLINQIATPAINQYRRLPEIDFNANYPNLFHDLGFHLNGQAVNFDYDSFFPPFTFQRPVGQRIHLQPGFSFPIVRAGGYITPQVLLDSTTYSARQAVTSAGVSRPSFQRSRNLPIVNLDAGLFFQRHFAHHQHDYVQTLEPRFFYLYVPFENQANFPDFDTQFLPFSYEQLFALNRFTGFDRLQNANQMTFGITSRIFDATTGEQKLRAGLGIIYYITRPRVTLPNTAPTIGHTSPLVGQLIYYPAPHWSISGSSAWDFNREELNNAIFHVSYSGDTLHIVTIGYEFVRANDPLSLNPTNANQNTQLLSLGFSWPLTHRWSVVGYWYYNIAQRRAETYYAGLQYDTCCWALRFLADRHFTGTATNTTTGAQQNEFRNQYVVQLMLKGLGSFGNSNPSALLTSTLPGFHDTFR